MLLASALSKRANMNLAISGTVVHGYKRGSKELGFPTANLDTTTDLLDGVYCGWAKVKGRDSEKHMMVMSVGTNPHYRNETRSVEVHVLNTYEADFYGETLMVGVQHYIRGMLSFSSTEELIKAIDSDITKARALLGNKL